MHASRCLIHANLTFEINLMYFFMHLNIYLKTYIFVLFVKSKIVSFSFFFVIKILNVNGERSLFR